MFHETSCVSNPVDTVLPPRSVTFEYRQGVKLEEAAAGGMRDCPSCVRHLASACGLTHQLPRGVSVRSQLGGDARVGTQRAAGEVHRKFAAELNRTTAYEVESFTLAD